MGFDAFLKQDQLALAIGALAASLLAQFARPVDTKLRLIEAFLEFGVAVARPANVVLELAATRRDACDRLLNLGSLPFDPRVGLFEGLAGLACVVQPRLSDR